MTRSLLAVAAAALAVATPLPAASPPRGLQGPFGTGPDAVWVILPQARMRSIVVFAHGWKHAPPATPDAWPAQFGPWLDHLTANGSAVVFPRYQVGGDASLATPVQWFRRGVTAGLARLHAPGVPVVVVGYSFGGSLAFTYAADAQAWHLPPPAAVDSIFPAGPVPGVPLPPLHGRLGVLVQVGDRDTVAGTSGAKAFLRWLRGHVHPSARLVVVHSTAALEATHAAPKSSVPAARRAFWAPLDRLVAQARR